MKQLTPSRTRSRKHPLGLTLLSENYRQLLADFQDFQGAHRDNSDSTGQLSGLSTPPEQPVQPANQQISVQTLYSIINKPCRRSGSAKTPRTGAGLTDAPQQHPADGSAASQGAAPATPAVQSKGSKTPGSNKPSRTPSKKQKPCDDGSKQQQHQPKLSPRQPSAAAADTPAGDAVAVQKTQTPQKAKQQHSTPKSKQSRPQGSKGTTTTQPCAGMTAGATSKSTADAQAAKPAVVAAQPAAAVAAAAEPAVHVQASTEGPDRLQHPQQQQSAQVTAACAAATQQQPQQQQQQQSQRKDNAKHSRRRVGTSSQPLTQSSSSTAAAVAPPPAAVPKDTGHGHSATAAFELPPLPLQRLHAAGPVQLPPLHPTTARAGPHSASSAKASRSEPASARMSRRASDNNADESAVRDTAGRRSDSSLPAAAGPPTVRHHSLPEPAAVQASSRRHSIACLIEVSRKQQQARHKAEADGGLQTEGGDTAGPQQQQQQQRPQQQQLQPLKQLLEMRRRGQLRPGGDDSNHDCQILVLDGPNPGATTYNLKQGTGASSSSTNSSSSSSSSQHAGLRQQGAAAATSVTAPQAAAAAAAAGASTSLVGHRRTRSSNTQLPPLDEHAVLAPPSMAGPTQAGLCGAPFGMPQLQSAAAAAGDGVGLLSCDMEGLVGAGHISRRSSRADSDISSISGADSTSGTLVCEPSSFGVCADPAGAVHLVTPAIPDKLARLRQRLPSRLTADSVAAAAAVVPGGGTAADQLLGATALQASTQQLDGLLPQAAPQSPPAASKSERPRRAHWQLPAVNPQQQQAPDTNQPEQQQQQQQQQHGGQHELPAACRSASYRQTRGSAPGSDPGQYPAASNAAACGAGVSPVAPQQQHPQSWDGGTATHRQYEAAAAAAAAPQQQQQQQQQQQGVNMTFMAELRRQLDHWAQWVHMHHTHPQQVPPPPQLPPQLATLAQQEQYQHLAQQQLLQHQQQQQVLLQQQQQGFTQQFPQQFQQQFPLQPYAQNPVRSQQDAAAGGSAGPPAGALRGFIGPVPAHGALSRFTDPWAEKQQQRLLQHRQGAPGVQQGPGQQGGPSDAAVAQGGAHPHVLQSGQDNGSNRQQQQQREAASPPVVSAAALAQQRRATQQQAFEGLSLEAVLASAQKTKPPSCKNLLKEKDKEGHSDELV